jgi:hypothetical protein
MSWTQNANLRRAGVEADEKTNDPASDSEAARVFISPTAAGAPVYL